MVEVFVEKSRHAREAADVNALPLGSVVEVEAVLLHMIKSSLNTIEQQIFRKII